MASVIPYKAGWRAIVRRTGFPTRTKTFRLQAEAEKWARGVEAEMDKKVYVVPSGAKVRGLFEKFRDEVSVSREGAKWEKVRINKFLNSKSPHILSWINKKIEDVDRFDMQAFRDGRLKEVSAASVNRELNLISGIITHAMREWAVALRINPIHEIKRPPKTPARKRRLESFEHAALVEQFGFDETKPPRSTYGAVKDSVMWVFNLALETGMRSGELLDLDWKHVYLDKQFLHVAKSKNGDTRDVPLTERAEHLLRLLRPEDPQGRVFPINKGSFEVTYRKWRIKAGIEDLHFHDTRHEAASRLAPQLENLELAKILGHRDPRTTMIYYNPTPGELVSKLRGGKKS